MHEETETPNKSTPRRVTIHPSTSGRISDTRFGSTEIKLLLKHHQKDLLTARDIYKEMADALDSHISILHYLVQAFLHML